MVDTRRWQHAFLLLVLITFCIAKPLESTGPVSDNEAPSTPCPEEWKTQPTTMDEHLEEKEQTDNNSSYQSEAERSHQHDDTTTLCPEELEKQNHENNVSEENEALLNDSEYKLPGTNGLENKANSNEESDTTTMCPEKTGKPKNDVIHSSQDESETSLEDLQGEGKNPNTINQQLNVEQTSTIPAHDQSPENIPRTTTICPEELAKHQEETGGNELSVKTLLNVQKDSVLLKLVKKKFEAENSKSSDPVRRKRQTQKYSPYYSNQPIYNSQHAATYNNVKTYQQVQRQYQNTYPKAYQNYVKPIRSYQKPSSYLRYPSNGNFKNLYKLKNGGNRRQYQVSVRPKTTTIRPARATPKKKFRPSPVFA